MKIDLKNFLENFPNHVIQYFYDNKQNKNNMLAKTSTVYDFKEATSKQEQGCGAYFSLNGFSNGNRKKENLISYNAIGVDLDVAKEQENLSEEKLKNKKTYRQNTNLLYFTKI